MGICWSTGAEGSESERLLSGGTTVGGADRAQETREKMLEAAEKRKQVSDSKKGRLAPLTSSAKMKSGGTGQGDLKWSMET